MIGYQNLVDVNQELSVVSAMWVRGEDIGMTLLICSRYTDLDISWRRLLLKREIDMSTIVLSRRCDKLSRLLLFAWSEADASPNCTLYLGGGSL